MGGVAADAVAVVDSSDAPDPVDFPSFASSVWWHCWFRLLYGRMHSWWHLLGGRWHSWCRLLGVRWHCGLLILRLLGGRWHSWCNPFRWVTNRGGGWGSRQDGRGGDTMQINTTSGFQVLKFQASKFPILKFHIFRFFEFQNCFKIYPNNYFPLHALLFFRVPPVWYGSMAMEGPCEVLRFAAPALVSDLPLALAVHLLLEKCASKLARTSAQEGSGRSPHGMVTTTILKTRR